jgi:hypothetical protein
MKKIILLISGIVLGNFLNAQVIFNIESPTNLAGNYNITYSEPGTWSSPDMLDPANAITGILAIVDDGTAADSLGCNPLVNNADIAGKIAVVYRGECQFGTKSLNAQNAGAIAVLIINNVPGDPIGMDGGTDGVNVTIPVAMISQLDGQIIRAVLDQGTDVTAFFGNKVGLFDTDMGVKDFRLLLPSPNGIPTLLAQSSADYNFRVGAWLYNYGRLDQTNVTFRAEVNFGDNIIYTETESGLDITSADSIYVELPIFSQNSYPAGVYTLKYTIITSEADEYDSDNVYSVDFNITEDVFSHVRLNENGLPSSTTGYRSTAATTTFSSCIHFRHPNASKVKAHGMYFAATTNADGSLEGQELITTLYKINDVFNDLNDLDFNIDGAGLQNIEEIANSSYQYDSDSLAFETVYAPFSSPAELLDNQRYMFCVSTFDPNTFIGYGDLDYSWTIDTVLQPMFPIQSNTTWSIIGFGGESSAIGVKLVDVNSTANIANINTENFTVYPNPSSDVVKISGKNLTNYKTISLQDLNGKTVKTWKISNLDIVLDVKSFDAGIYNLVFEGNEGSSIEKIQILK